MKCLIDMDGVLVDCHKGLLELLNIEDPYLDPKNLGIWGLGEVTGIDNATIFEKTEHEFWANLEWTEEGAEILNFCLKTFGVEECCILSTPTRNLGCMGGKLEWLQKNTPELSERFIFARHKHFVAHSNTVLIDDKLSNVEGFKNEGGNAVLVPRPWSDKNYDQKTVVDKVKAGINAIVN